MVAVPERIAVIALSRGEPERFIRIGAGLLAGGPEVALAVASLDGETTLLGRHQRRPAGVQVPVVRRIGGGREVKVGSGSRVGVGTLGVYLRLPSPSALGPGIGMDRVINRAVRGLVSGLGVNYFGRDTVSYAGAQVGSVSLESRRDGALLFEAYVETDRTIDDVIAGYRKLLRCETSELHPDDVAKIAEIAAIDPPVDEDETGFVWSGRAEVPIGGIEALVRRDRDGDRIVAARLRGDFIAPSWLVRAIEAAVVAGGPGGAEEALRTSMDEPAAFVIGLDDPGLLAVAFHAAARST
jgi:hypothetical protein